MILLKTHKALSRIKNLVKLNAKTYRSCSNLTLSTIYRLSSRYHCLAKGSISLISSTDKQESCMTVVKTISPR